LNIHTDGIIILDEVEPPAPLIEAAGSQELWRRQHHGVWSHTDSPNRKAPKDIAKNEYGELLCSLLLASFATHASASKRVRCNKISKASVFKEFHAHGFAHYHAIVLCEAPWSPLGLKRVLQEQGIYVEWNSEHDYYWTNFVYLTVPSTGPAGKTYDQLDQTPWLSEGHADIRATLLDMPRGARSSDKNRVRRFLGDVDEREGAPSQVSFSDKEFAAHVIPHNLGSVLSLQAWVQAQVNAMKADKVCARGALTWLARVGD
jgi:hypothetical protein